MTLAEQQCNSNKENAQHKEYLYIWNDFNNENKLDEKGGCYKYGKEPVKIILIQNSTGLIEKSVTQADNKKTQCFVNHTWEQHSLTNSTLLPSHDDKLMYKNFQLIYKSLLSFAKVILIE